MPPQRRLALLTYASPGYEAQQRAVVQSARRSGFTDFFCWNLPLLEQTEFYARHRQILDQRKGGGYWLWKPYLIARELARLGSGDFLVYTDSGYPWRPLVIRQSLEPLLDWCERENGGLVPGVYIPRHGANRRWTKRECFITMNCDCEPYWGQPQIQATFSVWQKCARAEGFVAEWLAWCVVAIKHDTYDQCSSGELEGANECLYALRRVFNDIDHEAQIDEVGL